MTKTVKSLAAVARYFGVARQTAVVWKKKGMPVNEDGTYDLKEIASWRGVSYHGGELPKDVKASVVSLKENSHLTDQQISRVMEIGLSTVKDVIRKHELEKPLRDYFVANRVSLLQADQAKERLLGDILVEGITEEQVRKLGIKERVDLYIKLRQNASNTYKDERLELEKSTDNVAVLVKTIYEIRDERRKNANKPKQALLS